MLSPILMKVTAPENAQMVKTASGRALDLVTVDTDAQGELAMDYEVRRYITYLLILWRRADGIARLVGKGAADGHCFQGRRSSTEVCRRAAREGRKWLHRRALTASILQDLSKYFPHRMNWLQKSDRLSLLPCI